MIVVTAPYEHFWGCKNRRFCQKGWKCVSENVCTGCSFGKCIQRAKEGHSQGFSYTSMDNKCNLCTSRQIEKLISEAGWGVYSTIKTGNSSVSQLLKTQELLGSIKIF